jgi:hypothetical protein
MTKQILKLALGLGLLGTTGAASAQSTIDTTAAFTGNSVYYWGNSDDTPGYGQVFTAPAGASSLYSFEFFVKADSGSMDYTAYLFAWNGTSTTGAALYTSTPLSMPASDSFTPQQINTGGIAVTPGSQYLACFYQTSGTGQGCWAAVPHAAYSGGGFVYGSFVGWNRNLMNDPLLGNSSMVLSFAPVPEPSAVALAALNGIGLVLYFRRKLPQYKNPR